MHTAPTGTAPLRVRAMARHVADHDVLTNVDLNNALFLEVLNEDQVEDRSNAPLLADLNSDHMADDQAIVLDHHISRHAAVVILHVAHLAAGVAAHRADALVADAEVVDEAAEKCQPSIHHNS